MSYTPTVWNTGDIVSSQKLNKLEEGVEGAYEVMVINDTNGTLDKTWQEIYDAMAQKNQCVIVKDRGSIEDGIDHRVIKSVFKDPETEMYTVMSDAAYDATTVTDYPTEQGVG